MLRALSNPRKAQGGGQQTGAALVFQLQGTGSSQEAPPSLSPPGQDWDRKSQENKAHIFPCEAERPVLGKQWPRWDQRELGPDWGQKLSPSWTALLLLLQRLQRAHPTFPPDSTPNFPTPLPSLSTAPESSLMAPPQAGHVLLQSRPLLRACPLPQFLLSAPRLQHFSSTSASSLPSLTL